MRALLLLLPAALLACTGVDTENDTSVEADADTDTDTDTDSDTDSDTDTDTDTDTDIGPVLVYAADFEEPQLAPGGYTTQSTGDDQVPDWVSYYAYQAYYDYDYNSDFIAFTDGGLMYPDGSRVTTFDPLAAPASGRQAMYITAYNDLAYPVTGGTYVDTGILVEAGMSYELKIAIAQQIYYPCGTVTAYLFAGVKGDYASAQSSLYGSDLAFGEWNEVTLTLDPADTYAGSPLYVQLTMVSDAAGYTAVLFDNVRITATPAAAN